MTPDQIQQLGQAIDALTGIYITLGCFLIIELVLFIIMEWRLQKPITKFTILLLSLGTIQACQYFFYSVGKFMEWNYITFPQVTIEEISNFAGHNMVMTITYNTLAIPTVVLYIYYIYCRSQSLTSMSESAPLRRKVIKYGVNILVTMWAILLFQYYFLDIVTFLIFTNQSTTAFDIYTGLKVSIPVTGIGATFMMICLDLNFQYWFYSFLKEFKKTLGSTESMQSRSQSYFIIAEHCIVSTGLSIISFAFVIARDSVGNRYYELFFEFAKCIGVFGVVSTLVLMRFRIEWVKYHEVGPSTSTAH